MNIWVVRVFSPDVANVRVPRVLCRITGSSGMVAARQRADIAGLPLRPNCTMKPGSARVFESWPYNAYISSVVIEGEPTTLAGAAVRLRRQFRMNRHADFDCVRAPRCFTRLLFEERLVFACHLRRRPAGHR